MGITEEQARAEMVLSVPVSTPIGVSVDVLGSSTQTQIGATSVVIHVPMLVDDDDPILRQPTALDGVAPEEPRYTDGRDPDDGFPESPWGYARVWEGSSLGAHMAITQLVATCGPIETDQRAFLRQTFADFAAWLSTVRDWCEAISLQDLDPISPRRRSAMTGDHWDGWHHGQPIKKPTILSFDFEYGDPLGLSQWRDIMVLAGRGAKPPVEHLLLRDARSANVRKQFRRCVLDAATALEIALHKMLVRQHKREPSALGDVLLKECERATLGRLLSIARASCPLPEEVTESVIAIRNRVAHKEARTPTQEQADSVLAAAAAAVAQTTSLDLLL